MTDVDVHARLFTREEVASKSFRSDDGRAHASVLQDGLEQGDQSDTPFELHPPNAGHVPHASFQRVGTMVLFGLRSVVHMSLSELFEEAIVHFKATLWSEPEVEFLEHRDELVAVYEFDRACSVSSCFALGLLGERACGENDPLVCASLHCPAEVSDLRWSNATRVPFALEQHFECHEGVELENPMTIDAVVAASAGDRHLLETRLA